MITTKKYRHRPVYKKFVNLRDNVQNRQKVFKFKKKKWQNLLFRLNRLSKTRKRNCYYKFYDQNSYNISKYNNFFSKNYKQDVLVKKKFNLFYGSLREKYLKACYQKSRMRSNQIKNKINAKHYFYNFLEKRLDVTLLRAHFVLGIRNSRQLISHGHVFVNHKVVTENSFLLQPGDLITFSSKSHKLIQHYLTISEMWPLPPEYLQISYKLFQVNILEDSTFSNVAPKHLLWLNLNDIIRSYTK
jgi:ribosomal protein S4